MPDVTAGRTARVRAVRPGGLRTLRLAGFGAGAVLAAGAYGAGALPTDGAGAPQVPDDWISWLGLAGWFAGLVILTGVWWRLGLRIRRRPGSVPLGWLLRTGLLWAAPLLVAPPVGSRDAYAYACQGALWLDGVDPYTVGVLPGGCVWADAVPALWRDTTTPYGPLAVALAGGAVAVARLVTASTDGQLLVAVALLRAEAVAGVLLVAGCLPRLVRAGGVEPVRAAWLGLVSPLVLVHAIGGAHNDALVLGLVVAALALAASDRTVGAGPGSGTGRARVPVGVVVAVAVIAGGLLGLAVAIKVTAIVALPFALLLAAARPDAAQPRSGQAEGGQPLPTLLPTVVVSAVAGLAGAGLAFAGVSLATRLDLGWLGALSDTGRLVQWTSIPTGLGMAAGYLLRILGHPEAVDGAVAAARLAGLLALAGTWGLLLVHGCRVLVHGSRVHGSRAHGSRVHGSRAHGSRDASAADRTRTRRHLVGTTGVAFTALALLSPVFYPWYGLTAVAVLAVGLSTDRWVRRVAVAVIVLSFLVLPGGLGLAVLTKLPGALLDVALVAVLTVVAYRRWRRLSQAGRPNQRRARRR
ncbi:polyprenol phosphomannose-dependent alpha 1,6 mannosyltransferase MptB [Plantactinospora sp. WMMC1484]|uniref:polyprenol phosphomannose-dependent alpha 1,6 mannosyltransferase MptB n=1 Tax=Plantactinospora sp. WMMC1484 TaxID=3404122 RepID=UPI003BF4FEAA